MNFVFLILYIILIIGIGIFSKSKIKGMSDFFLGGRAVNPWMSAFSYGTAYFSAVMFIGYAGKIGWGFGVSALWIVAGNAIIGSFLAWQVLGKRTREMTQRLNVSTMPEFISVRYQSKSLKIVTALIIFIFLVPYTASVYKGLGYLFEEIFGIPMIAVLLLMTGLTALYLFLGGFVAATIADFVQGLVMIIGVVFMLFYVINHPQVGGIGNAVAKLGMIDPKLAQPIGPPGFIPIFSLVILTSLGSWGLPQMVHKFYTIKSEKAIFSAKWVTTAFAALIAFGAYFTGVISRLVLGNKMPETVDMIIPQVIARTLPEWVCAIILVLILSASMSTLASLVLASSSAIALDLLKGAVNPNIEANKLIKIMRILCVVFVVLSFLMAIQDSPIISMASLSWGAVSGSLLAPYLLGLYWKRTTKNGVWAGIVTALSITIVGGIYFGLNSPMIPIISAIAIVLPIIIVPVVSVLTEKIQEEYLEYIFSGKKVVQLGK
jgi:SSS family solute:Na+ symporter